MNAYEIHGADHMDELLAEQDVFFNATPLHFAVSSHHEHKAVGECFGGRESECPASVCNEGGIHPFFSPPSTALWWRKFQWKLSDHGATLMSIGAALMRSLELRS